MIGRALNSIKRLQFKKKWRKLNGHNQTTPNNFFSINSVTVGNYSYGELNIMDYGVESQEKAKLTIGNFVSIAKEVKFLLNENHQTKTATTFPLSTIIGGVPYAGDAVSRGPIIIEDEVWIGYGVIILSGVQIGKGAIVGAGAVVTKNIPPYSIACGVPATVLKERFPTEITQKLMGIKLSMLDPVTIRNNIELFYKKISTPDDVDALLALFKRHAK